MEEYQKMRDGVTSAQQAIAVDLRYHSQRGPRGIFGCDGNRWEKEYALELEARRQAGNVLWWGYQAIKLRLADRTWYTPDFAVLEFQQASLVLRPGEGRPTIMPKLPEIPKLHFIEIKGFMRDDANVKFKVAAEQFPCFCFRMYGRAKSGGWELMKGKP